MGCLCTFIRIFYFIGPINHSHFQIKTVKTQNKHDSTNLPHTAEFLFFTFRSEKRVKKCMINWSWWFHNFMKSGFIVIESIFGMLLVMIHIKIIDFPSHIYINFHKTFQVFGENNNFYLLWKLNFCERALSSNLWVIKRINEILWKFYCLSGNFMYT